MLCRLLPSGNPMFSWHPPPSRAGNSLAGRPAPRFAFLNIAALLLFYLGASAWLHAETISGTVKDPSGAVVAEARIEISGGTQTQPIVLSSDALGRFVSSDLQPGKYTVRITHDGFEPLVETVELQKSTAYQNVTYPKGAYVLQMLRSIMYGDNDQPFIDMMHDFVESH